MSEHPKMNPEFKVRWVEALRSGKYPHQAKGFLQTGCGFCCIGIAADLIDPTAWEEDDTDDRGPYGFRGGYEMLNLKTLGEISLDVGAANILAQMNDDGKSFAEIADWIEANL